MGLSSEDSCSVERDYRDSDCSEWTFCASCVAVLKAMAAGGMRRMKSSKMNSIAVS